MKSIVWLGSAFVSFLPVLFYCDTVINSARKRINTVTISSVAGIRLLPVHYDGVFYFKYSKSYHYSTTIIHVVWCIFIRAL